MWLEIADSRENLAGNLRILQRGLEFGTDIWGAEIVRRLRQSRSELSQDLCGNLIKIIRDSLNPPNSPTIKPLQTA